MIEISEVFPKNAGLYFTIQCGKLQIFALIKSGSRIITVINGSNTNYYNLKLPHTLFGINCYLNIINDKEKCDIGYGTSIVDRIRPDGELEACYDGLPHSALHSICFGKPLTGTIDTKYNYYWLSAFVKQDFKDQYIFNHVKKTIEVAPKQRMSVKFNFLKLGRNVLITNNKKYKDTALHILKIDAYKQRTNSYNPIEIYIL